MSFPTVSTDPGTQSLYEQLRDQGESHNLAEMFATGQGPMLRTDATFLAGHCNGNQFADDPERGDFYAQRAKEAKVDITGKVYLSSLANYPGDPEAWVSSRGDVQRVCEERGWSCKGDVQVKAPVYDHPGPGPTLGDDLIEEKVAAAIEREPERAAQKEEVREEVIAKHKPHWAK